MKLLLVVLLCASLHLISIGYYLCFRYFVETPAHVEDSMIRGSKRSHLMCPLSRRDPNCHGPENKYTTANLSATLLRRPSSGDLLFQHDNRFARRPSSANYMILVLISEITDFQTVRRQRRLCYEVERAGKFKNEQG